MDRALGFQTRSQETSAQAIYNGASLPEAMGWSSFSTFLQANMKELLLSGCFLSIIFAREHRHSTMGLRKSDFHLW
jgi:hypothetical protein